MSIALSLLVVDGRIGPLEGFAHTMLELGDGHRELHALLDNAAEPIKCFTLRSFRSKIPDGSMAGESCYGTIKGDRCGQPLSFISAGDFVKLFQENAARICRKGDTRLHAARAYIAALNEQTLIALYYH